MKNAHHAELVDGAHPSRTIYARVLNALETIDLQSALRTLETGDTRQAAMLQLVAYVSDENGAAVLAGVPEALVFASEINAEQLRKIIRVGSALNAFTEEALEQTEKN
jgi:hypothetical protein